MKVGINGMGRIGRLALRAAMGAAERPLDDPRGGNRLEVVHLNEIKGGAAATAHLLAFDTVQGKWRERIGAEGDNAITIGAQRLSFSAHPTAADIPWGDLGVDVVLECTGKFLTLETIQGHLDRGAKRVIVAAPVKVGDVLNIVVGVNHQLYDPAKNRIVSATSRHENIMQCVHFVDDLSHKNRVLDHLLRDVSIDQALVFTATKRDADMIADRLNIAGFSAAALHGDMHQGARNRTLDGLRCGRVKILVATDVAARGIDVPTITHVVNYDLPKFAEDYVHRIGRTGRAGRNGLAISLVNHAESVNVKRIERFTKQLIPVNVIEGLEPKRSASAPRAGRKPDGWKPGGTRTPAHKPGQRSFAKPDAPRKDSGFKHARSSDSTRRAFGER